MKGKKLKGYALGAAFAASLVLSTGKSAAQELSSAGIVIPGVGEVSAATGWFPSRTQWGPDLGWWPLEAGSMHCAIWFGNYVNCDRIRWDGGVAEFGAIRAWVPYAGVCNGWFIDRVGISIGNRGTTVGRESGRFTQCNISYTDPYRAGTFNYGEGDWSVGFGVVAANFGTFTGPGSVLFSFPKFLGPLGPL